MSGDVDYSKLEHALTPLGFKSSAPQLMQYLLLLQKWNQAYNLTAVRDLSAMIDKHVIDSLVVAPWLKGEAIIDVGTGAGLPGIPLAITHPKLHFVLADSNGKKIRFLQEVKRQLSLNHVTLEQTRIESYHPTQGFDTVISRAFSSLEQMVRWTSHLLNPDGRWLAMKGHCPESELAQLTYPYTVESYTVKGIEGARCCVLIDNATKESSWRKS